MSKLKKISFLVVVFALAFFVSKSVFSQTNVDESYQAVSMCPQGKVAIGGSVSCVDSGDNIRPSLVYSESETNNFQNVGWTGACRGKGSVNAIATCVDPNQVSLYKGNLVEKKRQL